MSSTLRKKVSDIPDPSRDVTKLSLGGNYIIKLFPPRESLGGNNIIKLFPPRESLVSDIPAGDGNIANLFFTVYHM
jgi:hypothetical protein